MAAADAGTLGGPILDYPPPRDASRPPGPNDRQRLAHETEVDELLYGGAAGGGKTDYLIAEALAVCLEFPGAQVALFRRHYTELAELGGIQYRLLDRLPQPQVGRYNAQDHLWTLRNGSRLRLAHLARDADVTKYQGAEFQLVGFDQVEQLTEFQYLYLLHRLRVSGELAGRMAAAGYRPKAIASANPGGVGHGWVKRRFIDPFPRGGVIFQPAPTPEETEPGTRVFIPATLADNEDNVDPTYRRRLESLPDDERRAMLHGDWNVHKGQRFGGFRTAVHVIDPEDLPLRVSKGTPRSRGIDYGLDAPWCALWGARLADDLVVVYRELYAVTDDNGDPLTAREQAEAILAAETPAEARMLARRPAALDPACWQRAPGHKATKLEQLGDAPPPGSIAAEYEAAGLPVTRAYNARLPGVSNVADRLKVRRDGFPRLLITSNCRNLIRTLPDLQRDPRRPEDVDTRGEDHAYDALRYLIFDLEGGPEGTDNPDGKGPARPPRKAAPPARRRRGRDLGGTVAGDLRNRDL